VRTHEERRSVGPRPERPMSSEPERLELELLGKAGRLRRLMEEGLTFMEAVERMAAKESAEAYLDRNAKALEAIEERLLSPEYQAKFADAMAEQDPKLRAEKLA